MTARDAAALLDVVHEGLSARGTEPFPPDVLRRLDRLIPSDAFVGYQDADVTGQLEVVELVEVVGQPVSAAIEDAYVALGHQNPLCCRLRARESRVLRLSDFITGRRLRSLAYYVDVMRPLGIEHGLRLWLPAPPGRARSVYLERSGRDYSARDRTLLALLRPHLIRIHAAREARRRAGHLPQLTEREGEVLAYVADGKTNAEIATALWISPHTVRTHLENIFEKLGVRTRTAAAARLLALPRPVPTVADTLGPEGAARRP